MTEQIATKRKLELAAWPSLVFLVIVSSCFLLNRGLSYGQDLDFFIYRLEGIAQSIIHGEIPGRIQTSQANGYGYPVGVMYGNILYYPAAILRVLGLSLENCYRLVVLAVNLVTVLGGMYSFSKICGSRRLGLVATWLFALSYYRIEDITLRSDIGEASGMAFMPLVAMSFCLVLSDGRNLRGGEEKTLLPPWLLFGLSMSGVVLSNVPLTVVCAVTLFLALCLAMALFPQTRSGVMVLGLVKGTVVCLLLTAYYIVPLADYYLNSDLAFLTGKVTFSGTAETADGFAVCFSQLFAAFQSMTGGASENSVGAMPATVGLALFVAPLVYLLTRERGAKADKRLLHLAILAVVALLMCTTLFPWATNVPVLRSVIALIAKIQFPWRYLASAALLLSVISALLIGRLHERAPQFATALLMGVLALSVVEALFGISSWVNSAINTNAERIFANTDGVADGIFVPESAYENRPDYTIDYPLVDSPVIEVASYEKSGTTMTLEIEADGSGTVRLPAYNYLHYATRSSSDDVTVDISTDDQGRISLDVRGSGAATVTVWFDEPVAWRASELVSLAAACVVILYAARRKMRAAGPDDKTDRLERA